MKANGTQSNTGLPAARLHERGRVLFNALVFLLGVLLGGVVIGEVVRAQYRRSNISEASAERSETPKKALPESRERVRARPIGRESAVVRASRRVVPAVVSITVTHIQMVRDPVFDEFFGGFFLPEYRTRFREASYVGSGVIFDTLGHILTNYHVIERASKIVVNLTDGREFKGTLVGADPNTDLAVVKISAPELPCARLGKSGNLMLGETVIAIGNPFGYLMEDADPSVTAGIVSALNRNFRPDRKNPERTYRNMIQTDATINPGNSGGPLVNVHAQVVGINTFIVSPVKGSVGLGFAIPIDKAKRIATELIKYKGRRPIRIGLKVQELNQHLLRGLGLPRGTRGVVITSVFRGSPADKAGLETGDVISAVNGKSVLDTEDIQSAFAEFFVGEKVYLNILRGKRKLKAQLTLEERKSRGPGR